MVGEGEEDRQTWAVMWSVQLCRVGGSERAFGVR